MTDDKQYEYQTLIMTPGSDMVSVSTKGQLVPFVHVDLPFRAAADFSNASSPAGHTMDNTAPVEFLADDELLPEGFITSLPQGTREYFAIQANMRYTESGPLRAAVHMELERGGVTTFNIIVGGQVILAKFPIKRFLNMEDRDNGSDEALVTLKIDPSAIAFPPGKTVTDWKPINTEFRELTISEGATIRWDQRQVLSRFRLRANMEEDGTSKPALMLEAIVLREGTWQAVPEPKRKLLSRNQSSALLLWSQDCTWYSPMPEKRLPTVPGFMRRSAEATLVGEYRLRWYLQAVLRRADYGKTVAQREEYSGYMDLDLPYATVSRAHTFRLPYPFGALEVLQQVQPTVTEPHPGRIDRGQSRKFHRNGKVMYREISRNRFSLPTPSRPQKFNTLTKGCNLVESLLPPDAPSHLRALTSNLFNASIAKSTARTYATAAKHISNLEAELGRTFSWPLSPADSNLLLAFLLNKGVKPNTVRMYLSGARRIALSKGTDPPTESQFAKCMLRGYENLKRNPVKEAVEANHRPVTIPLLRLLGHSASKHWKGQEEDKLCFWTVCLAAFWGSLRLGEVLCTDKSSFAPGSALLGTDVINMTGTSFALWIRDPKVPKRFGDIVEIWSTPQFPDLDPFSAFSTYWASREKHPLSLPVFLMANGRNMTHRCFESTFHSLLSYYAMQLELSINRWTGHSFRSGLPTLLQSLGFSEEEIKAWGRWASSVFQLYARDVSKRFEVQRTILSVMDRIKTHVEKGGGGE